MGFSQSLFCQPLACHIYESSSKHFPNTAHPLVLGQHCPMGFIAMTEEDLELTYVI